MLSIQSGSIGIEWAEIARATAGRLEVELSCTVHSAVLTVYIRRVIALNSPSNTSHF